MIASVNLYHRRRRKGAALEVDGVPHALRCIGESQTCTAPHYLCNIEHEIKKTQEPINRKTKFQENIRVNLPFLEIDFSSLK